jgi:hypothetical protein
VRRSWKSRTALKTISDFALQIGKGLSEHFFSQKMDEDRDEVRSCLCSVSRRQHPLKHSCVRSSSQSISSSAKVRLCG